MNSMKFINAGCTSLWGVFVTAYAVSELRLPVRMHRGADDMDEGLRGRLVAYRPYHGGSVRRHRWAIAVQGGLGAKDQGG